MESFVLIGEGARLTVAVAGYENVRPQTVSDANWLQTTVCLEAGGCTLRTAAAITTQDVKSFLDELEAVLATLQGTASLTTDEGSVRAHLVVRRTGSVRISGEMRELGVASVKVQFAFNSDQSLLMRTISEIRDLQARYPVIDSV